MSVSRVFRSLIYLNMRAKHVYDLEIPLVCEYELGIGESVKYTLKVTDAARVQ
jgi:hypothetical protein